MQKGFSQLLVVIIVTGLALGGYAIFWFNNSSFESDMMEDKNEVMREGDSIGMPIKDGGNIDEMLEDDSMMMENDGAMMHYAGNVLAGKSSPLLDFDKSDYDSALKTDKLIVIYYYANWCPICRAEFPLMQEAFNELTGDNVIGFRVNYNDSETSNDEKNLAREHGVAYQHTKVFVRNGERIGKWPDSWDKARYISEIERRL